MGACAWWRQQQERNLADVGGDESVTTGPAPGAIVGGAGMAGGDDRRGIPGWRELRGGGVGD